MTSFQLVGLPFEPFSPLFALSDAELLARNVRRVFATTKPGYPCRVSLADAEIGDELLLLAFEHHLRVHRTSRPARSLYAKRRCKLMSSLAWSQTMFARVSYRYMHTIPSIS